MLQATARRLRSQLRARDTVARLGGDEFAVITPHLSPTDLTRLATRIANALARPHHIHGRDVHAPASIGTHIATPGADIDDVIRSADQAMYNVKHRRTTAPDGA